MLWPCWMWIWMLAVFREKLPVSAMPIENYCFQNHLIQLKYITKLCIVHGMEEVGTSLNACQIYREYAFRKLLCGVQKVGPKLQTSGWLKASFTCSLWWHLKACFLIVYDEILKKKLLDLIFYFFWSLSSELGHSEEEDESGELEDNKMKWAVVLLEPLKTGVGWKSIKMYR